MTESRIILMFTGRRSGRKNRGKHLELRTTFHSNNTFNKYQYQRQMTRHLFCLTMEEIRSFSRSTGLYWQPQRTAVIPDTQECQAGGPKTDGGTNAGSSVWRPGWHALPCSAFPEVWWQFSQPVSALHYHPPHTQIKLRLEQAISLSKQ